MKSLTDQQIMASLAFGAVALLLAVCDGWVNALVLSVVVIGGALIVAKAATCVVDFIEQNQPKG